MRTDTPPPPRTATRLPPVLGLLLLAPVCAEYLAGYDDSTGNVTELLGGLVVFVPLYGCAALIVRETARRAGRGWPTMLLLATAFGVLQPGMIDQAMFNPSYRDIDYLGPMLEATYIPALGLGGYLSLGWVAGHVIFSVCAPIAIVETFVPDRRATPWLGLPGLAVAVVAFGLAAAFVVKWHLDTEGFVPTAAQLTGAGAVVVALIVTAFATGRRPAPPIGRPAPGPWVVGAVAFVLLLVPDLFGLVVEWAGLDPAMAIDWRGFAVLAGRLAVLLALLWAWSRRTGWRAHHRLAVAGGALLSTSVTAFVTEPIGDVTAAAKLWHNMFFLIVVVLLVASAGVRASRAGRVTV
ncbi:hypothetical protein [Spongiactinospora gelatinilytica]|uniref:hypothetical protein n=1 Tax=Spongiactinospora gelatinilytica TaxID=2666298 RepID=UPI0011B9353C|nr:hypothetical protein [Spongiactinospora gelatinilytica]